MTVGPERPITAVLPVRNGVLPLGADEATAEAGGSALVIGSGCFDAAQQLVGAARSIRTMELGHYAPGTWARAVAEVVADLRLMGDDVQPAAAGGGTAGKTTAKTQHHLLLPASPDGRDLGPRLAAVLDRDFVASAIRFDPTTAEVTRFGGRVTETLHLTGPVVATLQPGVRGVEAIRSAAAPTVIPIERATHRTEPQSQQQPGPLAGGGLDPELIEELPADPSTMDLAEADRIIGGGAGLGSPEAFEALRRLADRLGASTGGTRVVTDWGWLPVERQIGTTGVTVDPSLYVAFGISGAVQHTAGLGSPTHVISINLDPHCPMMGMADLAIVSDGPAVLDRLLTLLDR